MEWVIDDKYSSKRIVETPDILTLKQCMYDNGYKCKVNLSICDSSFWSEGIDFGGIIGPAGSVGAIGPAGAIGPVGPRGFMNEDDRIKWETSRQVADAKEIVVTIKFVLSNANAEKIITHELVTSKNNKGRHYPTWNVTKMGEHVPYLCGLYKRKGFDAIYNAMKVLKPSITEELLARDEEDGWDFDLVEANLFNGWNGCISTYTANDYIETGKSYVKLSLLSIDILKNIDYIKAILSPYRV